MRNTSGIFVRKWKELSQNEKTFDCKMEFLFTLSVVHYMESIYIGKLHHLFSGGLLTDGHEEGGLI